MTSTSIFAHACGGGLCLSLQILMMTLCTAFTSYLTVTMNSTYATNLSFSVIVYHVFFHYVSTLPCFCILLILNHIPQIFWTGFNSHLAVKATRLCTSIHPPLYPHMTLQCNHCSSMCAQLCMLHYYFVCYSANLKHGPLIWVHYFYWYKSGCAENSIPPDCYNVFFLDFCLCSALSILLFCLCLSCT